jgi:hypothetical protein
MNADGQLLNKAMAVLGPLLLAGAAAMAVSGLNSERSTRMLSSGEFEKEVRMVHPIALGNAISREHCEYKTIVDIRVCRDLDTGAKRREVRDLSGNWYVLEYE